jgi:hypothetical protein
MGWRNMYILLNDKKGSKIERILEYIDHHNNWYDHFTPNELEKMQEEDTIPGEELVISILTRKFEDKHQYWAYLGNHGGSGWSIDWAERYFPDIKIYNSSDFPYYNEAWQNWPSMKVEEYKEIKINMDYNEKL